MASGLPETSVAETLAEKIVALQAGALPAATARKCDELLIDVVGLCVTARNEDYVKSALAGCDDDGPCTAVGHQRTLNAAGAAFVTERESLARAPGLAAAATDALAGAEIGVDDVAHFDLYSCFPSAVQIAPRELGIDRRSASAHGHRRPRLRGRTREQLPDPRDRADGRRAARRTRRVRVHDRARLVRHEARGRGLVGPAAAIGRSGASIRRPPGSRSTRCPRRVSGRARRRRRRRRSDVGRVRARRHARRSAS